MTAEQASLILMATSALGALGAAVAAWSSARATSRAAEGQLFSVHHAEYATREMLRSLRVLRNWESEQGNEFAKKWKDALDANEQCAQDVDASRRQVKFYFMKILRLYESGFVSRRFLTGLAAVNGINILYDIVEPLEKALNPQYDSSRFESLRKLVGRAGTGRLFPPVPPTPRASGGTTDS